MVPARFPKRLTAMALAMGLLFGASGAHAETVTIQTRITILTPLSMLKTADMEFGNIARPAAAGTVVLNPTSTASCTTTGGLIRSGPCQAATFMGYGATNQIVRIRFNGSTVTLSNGLGQTMTVTNRTADGTPALNYLSGNVNSNGNVRYRIVSADGVFDYRVGGQLNVSANQALGQYTGSFTVQLEYD
jgi:hypothetical protein